MSKGPKHDGQAPHRVREYDHDYGTCAETFVTLCIYHADLDPDFVTRLLALQPTESHRRGEMRNPKNPRAVPYRTGAWFLTTEGAVQSRDARCHLDWLLAKLRGMEDQFQQLNARGYHTVINCYWESAHGHGGPIVWPETMGQLAQLGLELSFDVYFRGEDEQIT